MYRFISVVVVIKGRNRMTDKEAIERLKTARSNCVSNLPEIQEMYDMFDKAIEALEYKIGCEYCRYKGDDRVVSMCVMCHIGDDKWIRKGE